MKGKLPYFCWYPADFDVDENVKLMNIEEIGLYAVCLNHAWVNGSLPADPLEIARAMKVPKAQFLRIWPRVAPCFTAREDGRWVNSRQEAERVLAWSKSVKNRASAVLMQAKRKYANADVSLSERSANAQQQEGAQQPASDSDSGVVAGFDSRGSPEGGAMRIEWDDQWQDFQGKYRTVKADLIDEDFVKAHHVWRVLDFAQREDSIVGIRARIDAGQWDDPRYIPKPEKYLREDRKRQIIPRPSPAMSRGEAVSLKALEIFKRGQG